MKFFKVHSGHLGWALTFGLALTSAAPAFAAPAAAGEELRIQEQQKLMEKDMQRIREQIQKETKMSENELKGLDPELGQYLRLQGDADHVRATIRAGWDEGCRGQCTAEMVGAMNRFMLYGMQDKEAGEQVRAMIQEQARLQKQQGLKGDAQQQKMMQQLRIRTQERLGQYLENHDEKLKHEMNRLHERERVRLQEQEMLRLQEREMLRLQERELQRQQDQGGSGGGGQGGSGHGH